MNGLQTGFVKSQGLGSEQLKASVKTQAIWTGEKARLDLVGGPAMLPASGELLFYSPCYFPFAATVIFCPYSMTGLARCDGFHKV